MVDAMIEYRLRDVHHNPRRPLLPVQAVPSASAFITVLAVVGALTAVASAAATGPNPRAVAVSILAYTASLPAVLCYIEWSCPGRRRLRRERPLVPGLPQWLRGQQHLLHGGDGAEGPHPRFR